MHSNSIGCPKIFPPSAPSFVLVTASDMHLKPESEKRAKTVDFDTAKNIQFSSVPPPDLVGGGGRGDRKRRFSRDLFPAFSAEVHCERVRPGMSRYIHFLMLFDWRFLMPAAVSPTL